jgi:hypothetical protein
VFICSVYCISDKINNKQSNTRQKHLNQCSLMITRSDVFVYYFVVYFVYFDADAINRADELLFRCFCLVFDCLLCLFWRWYNKQSRWTLVQIFLSSIWLFIKTSEQVFICSVYCISVKIHTINNPILDKNISTSVHLLCLLYQRQNTHNKQSKWTLVQIFFV